MASPIELTAIVLGPVIGVVLTLAYQRWDRRYERRIAVYQALIVYRRHVVREEWVNAFNMVPIHFSRDKKVLQRHKSLSEHFATPGWREASGNTLHALVEKMEVLNAELVAEIGRTIGVTIPDLELLKGAYAPQLWQDREEQGLQTHEAIQALLEGRSAINVITHSPTSTKNPELSDQG